MRLLTNSENMPILQDSGEWHYAKMYRFSASKISSLIYDGKTKRSADKVENYISEKAFSRLLEMPIYKPTFAAMQRGKMLEPEARLEFLRQYKIVSDNWTIAQIDEAFNVGKCYIDDECEIHLISPDGYNGGNEHLFDGVRFGTEFKTAETASKYSMFCQKVKDAATLKEFDSTYYWQVMDALMCSGAKYWWFAYYLPEMQRGYDIRAVKIYPCEADFKLLRESIKSAETRYKEIYKAFLNSAPSIAD